MNQVPTIGQRVHFRGVSCIDPCDGVILGVYEEPDEPIKEWHVTMKPDSRPTRWPYTSDLFSPSIDEIEPIAEKEAA